MKSEKVLSHKHTAISYCSTVTNKANNQKMISVYVNQTPMQRNLWSLVY